MRLCGVFAVVLCAAATSFGAVSINGTANPVELVYGATTDLGTAIDPVGLAEATETPAGGMSKTAFLALNPQVVDFNVWPGNSTATAGSFAHQVNKITASYSATGTVQFTLPTTGGFATDFAAQTGYNYGGPTSSGRQAFSGSAGYCDLGSVPSNRDGSTTTFNAVDLKIATTGGMGVGAIGFCLATRANGGITQSNPVYFTLTDIATGATSTDSTTVIMPEINMASSHGFFIGYQAPAGKVITRVEVLDDDNYDTNGANMTAGLDDIAFVMTPEPATLSLLALSGLMIIRRRHA